MGTGDFRPSTCSRTSAPKAQEADHDIVDTQTDSDVGVVLSHRSDNGADFWATPDGRIYVGNPFSTISALCILHELGVAGDHEAVVGGVDIVLKACREDGRVRVAPRAPLYPCYAAEAIRAVVRFGHVDHEAVRKVVARFVEEAHESGGWRCNFTRFGTGPETRCGSPGATLYVLDVLRHYPEHRHRSDVTDGAVELLLGHWDVRRPIGPCHHGIGSLFLQVEYPFLRYNLFYYVYVLSHFERAREDRRFGEALERLRARLDAEGRVVVERPHRGLRELRMCAKGKPSDPATRRYRELCANLEAGSR